MAARRRKNPSPLQGDLLGGEDKPSPLDVAASRHSEPDAHAPLADRMRPRAISELIGQAHLFAAGAPIARAIAADRLPSLILWGPPGSGKTSIASVIAESTAQSFERLSAVLGGIADLRQIIERARARRQSGIGTIVFVDEIHRFNKAQQDAFLPHVEQGTITLIGATTENPSFSVNAAVLSRCKVFRLEALSEDDLRALLERALADVERGLGGLALTAAPDALTAMATAARGDARRGLGILESAALLAEERNVTLIDRELVLEAGSAETLLYDKSGEEHYNVISAFIKSMRGSDPDAAIYWLMRMLDAGEDPLFVLRRLVIFASEDVGNADPRALSLAVAADQAFQRLGMPEGLYPIAHACLYLASCPKSNSVGRAYKAAREAIARHGALPVPNKLRNAVTKLMTEHGYGDGYQYPHDIEGSYVPGETYLPERLLGERYYQPSGEGTERNIRERLARLRGEGRGTRGEDE
jgi:putative ATPase